MLHCLQFAPPKCFGGYELARLILGLLTGIQKAWKEQPMVGHLHTLSRLNLLGMNSIAIYALAKMGIMPTSLNETLLQADVECWKAG